MNVSVWKMASKNMNTDPDDLFEEAYSIHEYASLRGMVEALEEWKKEHIADGTNGSPSVEQS